MAMREVNVTEPAILIRISQLFDPKMSREALYEATRGVWAVGQRKAGAQYALAVADGVVHQVYERANSLLAAAPKIPAFKVGGGS